MHATVEEGIPVLSAENHANVLILSALGTRTRGVTNGASGRASPRAPRVSAALTMPKVMATRMRNSMLVSGETVVSYARYGFTVFARIKGVVRIGRGRGRARDEPTATEERRKQNNRLNEWNMA